MKTIALFLSFSCLFFHVFSQSNYEKAMLDGLDSLNKSSSLEDFQKIANYFERIASTEEDKWLPGYYTAYCYIQLAFREENTEHKEKLLNIAESFVDKLVKIEPYESEIYSLQGMFYQGMITLDFQNNAPTYSAKANEAFDKSIELNPLNPRPYSLKGMNVMHTPEAYGGGMKAACPLFSKAEELYDKFEKKNELMPDWGKEYNRELLKRCEKVSNL